MKTYYFIISLLALLITSCTTTQNSPTATLEKIDKRNITSEYELRKILSPEDYEKWDQRYPHGFSLDYETGMVRPNYNF